MMVKKGDWVQISNTLLTAEQRAPQVPEDTKKVPLKLWVKGYITQNAEIDDTVEIETVTGRKVKGILTEVNSGYTHSFGKCIPELLKVHAQVKAVLYGDDKDE